MIGSVSISGTRLQLSNNYRTHSRQVEKSAERLMTGKRINRASDDPAGLMAAESLRTDLTVLKGKVKSLRTQGHKLELKQSGLSQVHSLVHVVRGSVVSASGDTISRQGKVALQQEVEAVLDAMDLISAYSEGVPDSTALRDLRSDGSANLVDGDIAKAASQVDSFSEQIGQAQVSIAAQLRYYVDEGVQLYEDQIVHATETLSMIEDTDYAVEMAQFIQSRIMQKASLLAQIFFDDSQADAIEHLLAAMERESGLE